MSSESDESDYELDAELDPEGDDIDPEDDRGSDDDETDHEEELDDEDGEVNEDEDEDENEAIMRKLISSENNREITVVRPEDRVTSNVMSIFEYTEAISIRAQQIEKTNIVFTDVTGLTDPIDMAKKELLDNKCPLVLRREIGNDRVEDWPVNNMALPDIARLKI